MKILFTIGAFGHGGKERRMMSLMEVLNAKGFELAILANPKSPNVAHVVPLCKKVYSYQTGNCMFNIRAHKEAVSDFSPDVIHSWNGANTFYALLASRDRGCRIITSEITNARFVPLLSKEYWMTRINFHFSDTILSNSLAGLEAKVAPRGKGQVIYNGYNLGRLDVIDTDKYRSLAGTEELNAVMAARFSKEKDFDTVLKVASMARKEGLKIRFVLAGEGPDLDRIRSEASRQGLANVVFPGHVSDIDNLLCHMDVGILSTDPRFHQEGVSNSVIEYMAHGMPALVSRGASVSEVIVDGLNGYVVRERDPVHLLEKLKALQADRNLVRTLGGNACRMVKDRFDLDDMGERFIRLYQQILKFS